MNVFISQPMTGIPVEEIESTLTKATERAKKMLCASGRYAPEDIIILGNYKPENQTNTGDKRQPIRILGESIVLLADADWVFMCDGWQKSRGCRIEHMVARLYGMNIMASPSDIEQRIKLARKTRAAGIRKGKK